MTSLPKCLRGAIEKQIEQARSFWEQDQAVGLAGVYMPGALARKFRQAAKEFEWF